MCRSTCCSHAASVRACAPLLYLGRPLVGVQTWKEFPKAAPPGRWHYSTVVRVRRCRAGHCDHPHRWNAAEQNDPHPGLGWLPKASYCFAKPTPPRRKEALPRKPPFPATRHHVPSRERETQWVHGDKDHQERCFWIKGTEHPGVVHCQPGHDPYTRVVHCGGLWGLGGVGWGVGDLFLNPLAKRARCRTRHAPELVM